MDLPPTRETIDVFPDRTPGKILAIFLTFYIFLSTYLYGSSFNHSLSVVHIIDMIIFVYFFTINLYRIISYKYSILKQPVEILEFFLSISLIITTSISEVTPMSKLNGFLRILFCINYRFPLYSVLYTFYPLNPNPSSYFQLVEDLLHKFSFVYHLKRIDYASLLFVADVCKYKLLSRSICPRDDKETSQWVLNNFSEDKYNVDSLSVIYYEDYISLSGYRRITRKKRLSVPKNPISLIGRSYQSRYSISTNTSIYDDINFNIFEFHLENQKTISILLMDLFTTMDIFDKLSINKDIFYKLINEIELGYKNIPYHNSLHAADVTQFAYLLTQDPYVTEILQTKHFFYLLFVSSIHDFKHPGTDNAFEVDSQSKLSITYNDQSVLENYHISSFFKLLSKNDLNPFHKWPIPLYTDFRSCIIHSILQSDLLYHPDHISLLISLKSSVNLETNKQYYSLISTLLHISDLSSVYRPLNIAIKWATNYIEERCNLNDQRRDLGLPIDLSLSDKDSFKLPKNQLTFIDHIVRPLIDNMNDLFFIDNYQVNLELTYNYWKNQLNN